MKLSEIRRCGFDTETTGPNPLEDRIVTAALVVMGGGREDQVFNWLINPGVEIPEEATAVHGITTEQARAKGDEPGPALDDLAQKLAQAMRFGMPVVAFNAAFDWTILDRDLARHGLQSMRERLAGMEPLGLLDPFVIDKAVDKYRRGKRKLGLVCEHYGVELTDWHTADADARAAVLVMDQIAERCPELADMSPQELFAQQQRWAAEQAASLQAYFRSEKAGDRYDPEAVVDGSWPLRSAPA